MSLLYVNVFSRGDVEAATIASLFGEIPTVADTAIIDIIVGYTITEAFNLSVDLFLDTDAEWYFHIDADQELLPYTLRRMINADADVVTVHAWNRHAPEFVYWGAGDNHRRRDGKTTYFAQAVILCRRAVLEALDKPIWRPNEQYEGYTDRTGEVSFVKAVLSSGRWTHVAVDELSPHWIALDKDGSVPPSEKHVAGSYTYRILGVDGGLRFREGKIKRVWRIVYPR